MVDGDRGVNGPTVRPAAAMASSAEFDHVTIPSLDMEVMFAMATTPRIIYALIRHVKVRDTYM